MLRVFGRPFGSRFGQPFGSPGGGSSVAAPTAPSVSVAATSASNLRLTITAIDPTATSLNVYRSTNNTTFTLLANIAPGAVPYDDATGSSGVTYYYKVGAVNAGGETLSTSANGNCNTFGLIIYCKFDEASWSGAAGQVIDSSGNGNNGTAVNSANTAPGKFNNAYSGDGISKYLTFGDSAGLRPTVASWGAWVFVNTVANVGFISKRTTNLSNFSITLSINATSHFTGQATVDGTTQTIAADPGTVSSATWYHVFATFNGTSLILYINGAAVATTALSGTLFPSTANLYIGAVNDPAAFFANALIDEFRFYNRALSAAEVAQLFAYVPN